MQSVVDPPCVNALRYLRRAEGSVFRRRGVRLRTGGRSLRPSDVLNAQHLVDLHPPRAPAVVRADETDDPSAYDELSADRGPLPGTGSGAQE